MILERLPRARAAAGRMLDAGLERLRAECERIADDPGFHRLADRVRAATRRPWASRRATGREVALTIAVVVLAAKLAKVDGPVNRIEIDTFKRLFPRAPGVVGRVGRLFDEARRDAGGFEPYAERIAGLCRDDPETLENVLRALCQIAAADGEPVAAERAFLRRVARILGVSDNVLARLVATVSPESDPYRVLGVARGADDDEVRDAWRRLLRENHPDAAVARGEDGDDLTGATRRTATINDAYARIREERARVGQPRP